MEKLGDNLWFKFVMDVIGIVSENGENWSVG